METKIESGLSPVSCSTFIETPSERENSRGEELQGKE